MGILKAKKEIDPDTVLQRKNDLLFNEIDGEVVMLSIENSEYYDTYIGKYNRSGTLQWFIRKGRPVKIFTMILLLEKT